MTASVPHVSASRVPALFDEHRYMTRRMLWEYCAKGIKPEDDKPNHRARSGRMLEGAILAMASEDLGCEVVHLPQDRARDFLRHPTLPTGCMPDGLVLHPTRGPGIVSVKNVSPDAWYKRWKDMEHGCPIDVEMQLQTELLVWRGLAESGALKEMGLPAPEWACIAAFEAGSDLHLFERRIEAEWHETLSKALVDFFTTIEADTPPPLSYVTEELPLAAKLWPRKEPDKLVRFELEQERENAAVIIATMMDVSARKKELEQQMDGLKVELDELSGDASVILTDENRCRITRSQRAAVTVPCPNCGTAVETRRAGVTTRYTPKEI